MNDDGLISIDVQTGTNDVLFVYEPDAAYDVKEILAYVHDMLDGRSTHIIIYEGRTMMHDLRFLGHAGWVSVAKHEGNGL